MLDPMLTQMNACAILCRERAILINLEHVKCIVTTSYVLVLNVENKAVLSFLDELQKKLRQQVRMADHPFDCTYAILLGSPPFPAHAQDCRCLLNSVAQETLSSRGASVGDVAFSVQLFVTARLYLCLTQLLLSCAV